MLDVKDSQPIVEIAINSEAPFYPGIANNRLYFHGTPNSETMSVILDKGLKHPKNGANTLARRISYSSDPRYSGGFGFIIGFEPGVEEIYEMPPVFARETGIKRDREYLTSQSAEFYLPGNTGMPMELFHSVRNAIGEYYEAGFDGNLLKSKLNDMVRKTERVLADKAVSVRGDSTPLDVHKIAQEIVWNELCGYTTHAYDNLLFEARELNKMREESTLDSAETLNGALEVINEYSRYTAKDYTNELRFIANIGKIADLGFEGLEYNIPVEVIEIGLWIDQLPATKKKDTFRSKFNSFIKSKIKR